MDQDLKKGSLIFLITPLADLIYVVESANGEKIKAKKLDSPPGKWEEIPRSACVKLADEQEKLLPSLLIQAVAEQRQIIFTPPRKKKKSLETILKGLDPSIREEMFGILQGAGITEGEEDSIT